jgi:hypothetical protein
MRADLKESVAAVGLAAGVAVSLFALGEYLRRCYYSARRGNLTVELSNDLATALALFRDDLLLPTAEGSWALVERCGSRERVIARRAGTPTSDLD